MFETNNKIHKMKARKTEKYDVKYAHTGRLKDSAIPYMQRLLNSDNMKIQEDKNYHKVRRPG